MNLESCGLTKISHENGKIAATCILHDGIADMRIFENFLALLENFATMELLQHAR